MQVVHPSVLSLLAPLDGLLTDLFKSKLSQNLAHQARGPRWKSRLGLFRPQSFPSRHRGLGKRATSAEEG